MLFEALVFLAAAVICVPILSRLGFGSILGYLVAGMIIGPWGLSLIDNVESTLHLAEFGVVLMLFVIGLELEPARLVSMRREIFRGGSIQLFACAAALAAGLIALELNWKIALVAGVTLALSSTAIAMQTLAERNELPTPTGRSAFAVLLFQDIAAIPLIALVPLMGHVDLPGGQSVWMRVGIAFAAIAGVVVIGRYLTRPALRLIASTGLREMFTAFTLLLVIGIALFAGFAGLSMALGAFLAGVLLASSEYRHALESDIEPFKGLLLGLFFIAVGMTIDFDLLARNPDRIAILVAGLLGLKILVLRLIAPWLGVAKSQRWVFAFLLSQGGEFAFVVFEVARAANVLPREWQAQLTIAVALSMAATPMLLLAYDKLLARRARGTAGADKIEEEAPVIIAGFGRFGQIVGRLLFANGIRAVVLDHDPEQVETLRRFGFRVYYGDATRLDLLRAAGAEKAKLLINTIDDVADSLALVDRVRTNFPNVQIIARARNVQHYFELKLRGVEVIEREVFEGSLRIGRRALEALGTEPYRAREMADAFRRHNVALMDAMYPHYQDDERLMSVAKAGRQQLEEQFAQDRERFEAGKERWD
ncbi:glutathione-regulated potassium-efflux system protein KefC [Usitatibacter palustris]|uniref:Glutathione-regulated potassium-efflux system protein KefC n=1 Tax=Usitatibacter palustris TaxID=2732487 RepID=A0A6M4H5Y8_9PROT|nr:glutathione-regulated potassium-efflux system protein KefC [Usitatibacter palustris]QJR13317.1 Glutathione-regulated potassium-efflux system protein KefC [Usitatibacter palustris]